LIPRFFGSPNAVFMNELADMDLLCPITDTLSEAYWRPYSLFNPVFAYLALPSLVTVHPMSFPKTSMNGMR